MVKLSIGLIYIIEIIFSRGGKSMSSIRAKIMLAVSVIVIVALASRGGSQSVNLQKK